MKIAVVNTQVPFVRGGAELQAEWLVERLRDHGHEADLVLLPFRGHPAQTLLEQVLAARLTRLTGFDRMIGMRFPAYFVPHDDTVLWIPHQHRPAYDLWGTEYQELPDTIVGRHARDAVVAADNRLLPEARRLFVTSQVNARRMRAFNGLRPEILYPPLGDQDLYYCEQPGDYLFFPSRLSGHKRQELAILAMQHVSSDIRLVIAGPPDSPSQLDRLNELASDSRTGGRVELRAGWMPEETKLALLAGCLAVLFPPYDEDFGYITLESFLSSKPVITCTDSGGPLELCDDGVSGLVVDPDPRALADAIDRLAADRSGAIRMGLAGRERVRTLGIDWDHVVEELTA